MGLHCPNSASIRLKGDIFNQLEITAVSCKFKLNKRPYTASLLFQDWDLFLGNE